MTACDSASVPVAHQVRWLMQWAEQQHHRTYTLRGTARETGVTSQALRNILDGHTLDPRLDTLRGLCHFFEVSLDYFSCESETDCQAYLARRSIELGSTALQEIIRESQRLSSNAQQNVLIILRWLEAAQSR